MAEKTRKPRIEYSSEDLQKLESALNEFAETWVERPKEIKGKKQSVKVSILKCSGAIRTLLDRGYPSDAIADGLKAKGIEISPVTLKSYIADIIKADKADKTDKVKKTTPAKTTDAKNIQKTIAQQAADTSPPGTGAVKPTDLKGGKEKLFGGNK